MDTHLNTRDPSKEPRPQPKEKRITKMFSSDIRMILFWIILMWVILGSVYLQVMSVAEPTVKIVALIAGGLVGLFNTAALLAVSGHLKKKKAELYTEDITNLEKMQAQGSKRWDFVKIFDVVFILALCYVCLLIPIMLRGKVLVGGGEGGGMAYTFTWPSLLLCLGAAAIFGYFILSHSEKELKVLIDNVYGKKEEQK